MPNPYCMSCHRSHNLTIVISVTLLSAWVERHIYSSTKLQVNDGLEERGLIIVNTDETSIMKLRECLRTHTELLNGRWQLKIRRSACVLY